MLGSGGVGGGWGGGGVGVGVELGSALLPSGEGRTQ